MPDGREVVVKVQRPGIQESVEEDLALLGAMADWAAAHSTIGRAYNLPAMVDEFAFTLRSELDYVQEGRNCDRFRHNFADDPGIHIPFVCWDLSAARVLTLERVAGIKINDAAALDAAGISRRLVIENGARLLMRMIFEFGFFHADPHPGNFFVREDGSIALIDFGMVGHLNDALKDALLRSGLAVVRGDSARLADELYALGAAGAGAKRAGLKRDLDHLLERYRSGTLRELVLGEAANDILSVSLRHRLQLPGELVTLLRLSNIGEGLGTALDPDFRLVRFAAPYIEDFRHQRRSPKALVLRTT